MKEFKFNYDVSESSPALPQFHKSNARFRLIEDVPGAEKACCVEIFRRCSEQRVGTDGFRRSKWAAVRNENKQEIVKVWFECFPPEKGIGHWNETESIFYIQFDDVRAEVFFISLDTHNDIARLCCLELTGVWANEYDEIGPEVMWSIEARTGRYPAMYMGGSNWHGVIANTSTPQIKWDIFREI